jgi:uncharacterized membrane protein YgcG
VPSTTPRRLPRPEKPNTNARIGDGIAAAAASAGLLAAAAPAAAHAPQLTSYLKQGSSGPNVARLQRAMHIRATRRFDRRTKRTVLRFQRKHHLLVDAIVGPLTWDTLFHITPPPTTTTSSSSYSSSTSASSSTTGSSYSSSGGYSIPSSIVQCESGGSYSAVNSSSGAGGAYQIMPSTWAAYGGHGLPQDAPKAEQDRIAAEIYAGQGSSAWSC